MRLLTFLYSLLLVYIIAALVFWGISLNKQSAVIVNNEIDALHSHIDSLERPQDYQKAYLAIEERGNNRKRQYLYEGATFLVIILIGAGVVYSSIRSNHKLTRQQNNFILSVTHELKSPIAAIKLNLQTMGRRKLDPETQSLLIERSVKESDRLDDLCNNLLLASQMESRHFKPTFETVDLSEVVSQCLAEHQQRRSGHSFTNDLQTGCLTQGDPLLWKLAINNLIENAIKYSPSSSNISIQLAKQDDEIVLSIADEGEGIADDEKSKIFRKFYRIGNENSRKTKGTGLGLFLTAKIIEQYKGSISIRDNSPKGSIFEITVTAAPSPLG